MTLDEWPADLEVVERVPLRSYTWRGAAIDDVADRAREPRAANPNRSDHQLPTARAAGIAELRLVVDAHGH